jgi:hypothetical protein
MTSSLELESLPAAHLAPSTKETALRNTEVRGNEPEGLDADDFAGSESVTNALQQWNYPRANFYKYLATLLGFIIMGANDAAYGVSLIQS